SSNQELASFSLIVRRVASRSVIADWSRPTVLSRQAERESAMSLGSADANAHCNGVGDRFPLALEIHRNRDIRAVDRPESDSLLSNGVVEPAEGDGPSRRTIQLRSIDRRVVGASFDKLETAREDE